MGKRQDYLEKICVNEFGNGNHLKPTPDEILQSEFSKEINSVFQKLGGQFETPPSRFGSWDIDLTDFIIELDEERHFNRYRLITLGSSLYEDYKYFDIESYKDYCLEYEIRCIKTASWGKNWKNNSTEKQFGISEDPGNLSGNGSSRWKQRAFYDFLKDISSSLLSTPILRISIYTEVNSISIEDLIKYNESEIILKWIYKQVKTFNVN